MAPNTWHLISITFPLPLDLVLPRWAGRAYTVVMAPLSAPPSALADAASGIWSVYLLRCGDGSLYCGVTTDLARRIDQHSAGSGARYTRGRGPLTLVYLETQPNSSLALKREAAIKRLTRTDKEALIREAGHPRLPEKTPAKKRTRAANRAPE